MKFLYHGETAYELFASCYPFSFEPSLFVEADEVLAKVQTSMESIKGLPSHLKRRVPEDRVSRLSQVRDMVT